MWKEGASQKHQSLCCVCANACGKTACSWAKEFKPVEGWVAEPTVLSPNQPYSENSYDVIFCPKFVHGHGDVDLDDGDARRLAIEILSQAVEDWKALDSGKIWERRFLSEVIKLPDLVNFFNSKYFAHLVKMTLPVTPSEIRKALGVPRITGVVWS